MLIFALVKQRRKKRLVTVKKHVVKGKESDFGSFDREYFLYRAIQSDITPIVSYLNRKTLGYCKNQKNFQWVLWMNLFDYNYRQFHKSLRQDLTGVSTKFQTRYQHLTPAMKMGLTSTQLEWRDLIVAPIAKSGALGDR